MLLELSWQWPDDAIVIAITLLTGLLSYGLINLAIKGILSAATKRAHIHNQARNTRLGQVINSALPTDNTRAPQRAKTMASILRSISAFAIAVGVILTILSHLGIPMGPLLASAGIGGVALGFGAQSLVKDFLAGISMIIEDQYGVGDFIDTGQVTGTVEEVGLRTTRLRDVSGVVWYVRNGEILRIGNHSQGWSTALVDLPVSYDEDPTQAQEVLQDMLSQLDLDEPWAQPLLERPTVLGVDSVVGNTMTLRIMLKTTPNQQWAPQREIRLRAKDALAAAGIKGPKLLPPTQ